MCKRVGQVEGHVDAHAGLYWLGVATGRSEGS